MSIAKFDRKLGAHFLSAVPLSPGVYRVFDESGALVYIGKAKSLRRRLSQYRRASRKKAHRKMLAIIEHAARIEVETCASEHDARLLEVRLIREHRPRFNVDGAFSFRYPLIGIARAAREACFCFTTDAELAVGYELHGAFRSSETTWSAFSALMELLEYVGHRTRLRTRERSSVKGFYVFRFRQIPSALVATWSRFFAGESRDALRELTLALVENAGARGNPGDVQERIQSLVRFWESEAKPLRDARAITERAEYPVPQESRDALFVEARHRMREQSRARSRVSGPRRRR